MVVDAMGGDNAPGVVLEGVELALKESPDINIILTGPADVVEPFADAHERCEAHATTEVIEMGEHPAQAVRHKKDSSIVVGCRLVKEGEAQGFFSAGSTGACMSAATLFTGRIKGVKRPCLASVLPSPLGTKAVFADLGANADCKPEYLVQFARMSSVYAQVALGLEAPRVGLLNIGTEDTKGSQFAQECHAALKEQVPNFIGNVEGNALGLGSDADVIVTDGYSGNIALKTYEGVGLALLKALKGAFMSSTKTKVGALLCKDAVKEIKEATSAEEYGGAQLLGIKGVCLIGHGNSSPKAICSGIMATADAIRQGMPNKLAAAIGAGE